MDLGLGFTEGTSPILDVQGVRISGGISQEKKTNQKKSPSVGVVAGITYSLEA